MICHNLSIVSVCLASFAAVESAAADADAKVGLTLERRGTAQIYFAHHGRPLLSFGGISDFIFYASDDAYNYRLWADWAAEHGMNHVRAYPPLSWKHQVAFAEANGGDPNNVMFPYLETEPPHTPKTFYSGSMTDAAIPGPTLHSPCVLD